MRYITTAVTFIFHPREKIPQNDWVSKKLDAFLTEKIHLFSFFISG